MTDDRGFGGEGAPQDDSWMNGLFIDEAVTVEPKEIAEAALWPIADAVGSRVTRIESIPGPPLTWPWRAQRADGTVYDIVLEVETVAGGATDEQENPKFRDLLQEGLDDVDPDDLPYPPLCTIKLTVAELITDARKDLIIEQAVKSTEDTIANLKNDRDEIIAKRKAAMEARDGDDEENDSDVDDDSDDADVVTLEAREDLEDRTLDIFNGALESLNLLTEENDGTYIVRSGIYCEHDTEGDGLLYPLVTINGEDGYLVWDTAPKGFSDARPQRDHVYHDHDLELIQIAAELLPRVAASVVDVIQNMRGIGKA